MMRQVTHTVHVIGDYSQHQYIPAGNPILHARNLMRSYPENFGLLIIITRTGVIESFVRAFINIFASSFGSRVHIVHSWEQVRDVIAQYEVVHEMPTSDLDVEYVNQSMVDYH